ncbi:MAG: DEAD/DEAH box helicase family protein [Anaeromyxobacter sp.]
MPGPLSLSVLQGVSPVARIAVRKRMVFGRSPSVDVVLVDPLASERHAALAPRGGSASVWDLDSERGTYVNGRRIVGQHLLRRGDLLEMGNSAFEVLAAGESTNARKRETPLYGGVPDRGQPAVLLDALTRTLVGPPGLSTPWVPLAVLLRGLCRATTVRQAFLSTFTCSSGALSDLALAQPLSTCSPAFDSVRIVVGDPASDLDPVVQRLASIRRWSRRQVLRHCIRMRTEESADAPLHAKLLLLRLATGHHIAIVGSSNATFAGYIENCELNVALAWRFGDPHGFEALAEALWREAAPVQLALGADAPSRGRIRPYRWQAARIQALRAIWHSVSQGRPQHAEGLPGYTIEMPPGTGKTLIAAEFVRTIVDRGGRVLWLSHRQLLLEQAAMTLTRQLGPGVGIHTLKGKGSTVPDPPSVLLATDASAAHHLPAIGRSKFSAIIIDEAHRFGAKRYRAIAHALRTQMLVGLSATPGRRGRGLSRRAFEIQFPRNAVVQRMPLTTALRLKEQGRPVLAHVRHVSVETGWVLKAVADDPWSLAFQERRQLGLFAKNYTPLVLTVYRLLLTRYADEIGPLGPTLFFAVDVDHAARLERGLRTMFMGLGRDVWVRQFHSRISVLGPHPRMRELELRRDEFLMRARQDEQAVLIGVDIVSEGLDLPPVQTLILARPTLSLRLYAQMIGRGLRGPAMGGGDYCNLVHFGAQTQIAGQRGRAFIDIRDVLAGRAPRVETLSRLQALVSHDGIVARTRADSTAAFEAALRRTEAHRTRLAWRPKDDARAD